MAGPSKKPKKTVPPADEDNSDSETGGHQGQQEIEATFEGRNPEQMDYHGIQLLLQQLFLKSHIDLSQMTDLVIANKTCGTVLHQSVEDEDDDDDENVEDDTIIFGVTSIINLTSHRETPCIQQLFGLLEEVGKKHSDTNIYNSIKRLVESKEKLGFLINERFINIPAKVSVPMLKCLQNDLEKSKSKDSSNDFQYYFLICKICKSKETNEMFYLNDEEKIFSSDADFSFEFSVEDEADAKLSGSWDSEDDQMIPFRKVIVFKADKFSTIISKIEAATA